MSLDIESILREEAYACLETSRVGGEYSTAFYVASIILTSLASRIPAQREQEKESSNG